MQELTDSQFFKLLQLRGIEIGERDGRLQINAPTGAIDPTLRAELVRRKETLLTALRSACTVPLTPANRKEGIPQTYAQQGMWLIDHFDPGYVAYNIPVAFVAEGAIDLEVLQKAVNGLIARQEILRASFYEEDGELLQSISPDATACVGFTDLSAFEEKDREGELKRLIREQARQPFDLCRAPMVRFHLFRLAEQRSVIFFNIHHIIADARSVAILREELSAMYRAALADETPSLPKLPVQYADYAIWAARQLSNETMSRQIEYWKSKLAGAPSFLELPSSRTYPEHRTAWGATTPVVIPAPLRDGLANIGREVNATPFMTLLAAFAVLLWKQSGKEDFCIGSPVTHRKQVETESLIGLFVNMVVFRCEMGGQPSFREVVRRMRNTALEAYENSDVPFQEVVHALKIDPRLRRSPLFQIMFGFESHTRSSTSGLVQIDTNPGTARFDLTLQLNETAEGIFGAFEYCTDLFEAASIVELARQFIVILEEFVLQPERPISSLQIPPHAERKRPIEEALPTEKPGFWSKPLKRFTTRLGRLVE